jgi:hypothetical protein
MYTTNFVYKAPPAVLDSLRKLFLVLQFEKSNFEHAAALIKDNRQFKDTLIQFLQETNQYLNELKCQIESLGGNTEIVNKATIDNEEKYLTVQSSKDVYEYCSKCENRILIAYREILNQSVVVKELRNMVRYQLNGLLCAFLQFRMLRDYSFRRI